MTARDLLQQRYTLANGDTAWRPSVLLEAALNSGLVPKLNLELMFFFSQKPALVHSSAWWF